MDLDLANKNVLIIGASGGIGSAIVNTFNEESANLFLVGRNIIKLKKLKNSLSSKNKKVFLEQCDVLNPSRLINVYKKIKKLKIKYDTLVLNIGDGKSNNKVITSKSHWEKVWDVNFNSSLYPIRQFLPLMKKNSSIIFISSIAGVKTIGAPTDYSVAKASIIALAQNLALKLAPNIRVNCVAPGNILFKGGSWENKIKKNKTHVLNMINKNVPLKRFGTPQEIANTVIFLASERSSFITGEVLVVDGGQVLN